MKAGTRAIGAAVAVVLMACGLAPAGSLDPTNAPGPTMHTLEEIYQQLLATQARVAGLERQVAGAGLTTAGDMVLIAAGSFLMGATTNAGHESIADAVPQHTAVLSAFYIDRCEVTYSLWTEVYAWATNRHYVFDHAGTGKAGDHPVHSVSWHDCLKWCNARSVRDGFTPCYTNTNGKIYTNGIFAGGCNWAADGYRLPTEAEWEKAARGGAAGWRFPWTDANTIRHARANYFANPAGYSYDTSPTTLWHPAYSNAPTPYTSPVGSFAPNGYGLYDVSGNVYEWCWDWYSSGYYSVATAGDPVGPTGPLTYRVMRGGSWSSFAESGRCANRNYDEPTFVATSIGLRCVRGL